MGIQLRVPIEQTGDPPKARNPSGRKGVFLGTSWASFSRLNILNIEQIKTFQVGEFMYRYHPGLLPLTFRGFFKLGTEIHSYFTRNTGAYRPPFARSNTRLFYIKHVGTLTWNKLSSYILLLPNVRMFKKQLRAFIINGSQ